MTRCFADTSYYIALINPDDDSHARASAHTAAFDGCLITSAWVLNELGNYLVRPPNRTLFVEILAAMRSDSRVSIVPMRPELFERGIALYGQRLDKEWSITDCISFLVMRDLSVSDALTTDHHFEQAGFNVLLK